MWKPLGSAGCRSPRRLELVQGVENSVGSRPAARQPRFPPCRASGASEYVAEIRRTRRPCAAPRGPARAQAAGLDLLGRGLLRHHHEHVLQTGIRVPAALLGGARHLGLHFRVRGHDDRVLDLALAQGSDSRSSLRMSSPETGSSGCRRAPAPWRKAVIDMLLSSAMRWIVFSTAASSILTPVSLASCTCTMSLIIRSRTWRWRAVRRRQLPAWRCSCPTTRRVRSASSFWVMDLVVHDRHDAVDGDDAPRRRRKPGVEPVDGAAGPGRRRRQSAASAAAGRRMWRVIFIGESPSDRR